MRVLVACEYSGRVRDAFLARGHDAISADLLDTDVPGPHYKGNVLDIINDNFDLVIAHPPCTRLTNAGSRWLIEPPPGRTLDEMWKELHEGCEFYQAIRNCNAKRIAIENPIMHKHAKAILGNPTRQVVQPWHFGEPAFKATGFELINLPNLVPTNKRTDVPLSGTARHRQWSWVHMAPPGPNRWKIRSTTFKAIAEAMADQWGTYEALHQY